MDSSSSDSSEEEVELAAIADEVASIGKNPREVK